jgi:hypothetical protein
MPNLASSKGKIMLALEQVVLGLVPPDISNTEVVVREDWLSGTGDPFRGVSVIDMGEQYDDGTVGTADIGYLCGIVFVKGRTGDARLPDDKIMQWYEAVRRRLSDQRLPVYNYGITAPKEHVCVVLPGKTVTNPNKWPNYLIRQLVVAVWIRENQDQY